MREQWTPGRETFVTFRSSPSQPAAFFTTSGMTTAANLATIRFLVKPIGDSNGGAGGVVFSNAVSEGHPALSLLSSGDKASMLTVGLSPSLRPFLHISSVERLANGSLAWERFSMDSTQGFAAESSWTTVAFSRSATDVKLYVSGYLSDTWPLATLHIDTSNSVLNRVVPPLIGASPGNGSASSSFLGHVDDLMGWSLPLSATDVSALESKSFSPLSLPPALVMLYDFDAVRRCDTRGMAGSGADPAQQVLTVEDRVGAIPAAATFGHIASVGHAALEAAVSRGGVLPTVGDADLAVATSGLPGAPLTMPVVSTYSYDNYPISSQPAPVRLAPCGFCAGKIGPVPDAGLSGLPDLALEVPVSAGSCSSPNASLSGQAECTGVSVVCRSLSGAVRLSAVPLPRLPGAAQASERGRSALVCGVGSPIRGTASDFLAGAAAGVAAGDEATGLARLRWKAGANSLLTADTLALNATSRPACARAFMPYALAPQEADALSALGWNATGEGSAADSERLSTLQAMAGGVPVAGVALAPANASLADKDRAAARAHHLSLAQEASFDGRTLPTSSIAIVGVHLLPTEPVPEAVLDSVAGTISEAALRSTLHSRIMLRRLVRVARDRHLGAAPVQANASSADGPAPGLSQAPGPALQQAPTSLAGTLVLDGSAWRGMLPLRYYRSELGETAMSALTPVVAAAAKPLSFVRTGPVESELVAPGLSSGLDPLPASVGQTSEGSTPATEAMHLSPVAVPPAQIGTRQLAVQIRHFACDRSEPGWPRWPHGELSTVLVKVTARFSLQSPSPGRLSIFLSMVATLLKERIGLSTSAATPFTAAEPWMAETSGWLSRQEVWVDIDAQNATLRPLHTPTGLASLAGEPALELNGTALGDLGSLVELSFTVRVQTRLVQREQFAQVVLDDIPQLSAAISVAGRELGLQQLRSSIDAAHKIARAVSVASGHGESWAQRQRCVASFA